MVHYKIFFEYIYPGTHAKGFFTAWETRNAAYPTASWTLDPTSFFGGKSMTSLECMTEYKKLVDHYQPYADAGTINDWKIAIHTSLTTTITLDELKEAVLSDVKSLGAKASFDATKMSDDEKLAIFYAAQYIAMQEVGNANRSILFREYIEDNLPASMQKEANGIVGAFPNLSAEILGNQKDTLIPDDEPYIETTNGGI